MKTIYQLALQVLAVLVIAGCAEQQLGTTSSDQAFTESAEVLTLAERAGAPLFDGMGDYEMPITTEEQDAQRYFNQGMVLAFAFNHAESIRSFRAAQTLDPTCAMCFW